MQLDLFAAPKPSPSASEPTVLRLEDRHSYAEIIIAANSDGTWGISTGDQYQGYCGHGSPMWGAHQTFIEALTQALARIDRGAAHIQVDRSSCCGDKHRSFAAKVRRWVAEVEAEYNSTRAAE